MTDQDTYTVERTAVLGAAPERVFEEIEDFHRWPAWSPWEDIDPEMRRTYSGPAAGTGATYAWSGNRKAGRGRMEITEATAASRVVVDLRFEKPFRSHNVTTFSLETVDEGTRVTWTMVGPRTFGTKVMGLFTSMDKLVGGDFEKGLARLAALVERST
jgi:uncharacterized protein YndB with AHSA1/START domain